MLRLRVKTMNCGSKIQVADEMKMRITEPEDVRMINVLKNRSVEVLSLANIFETLGVSIFNIVLLTYAKTYANPAIMVSVVSIATVVPGTLGFVIGFLADHVVHKDRMLVLTKVIQAGLYLVLALVIDARTLVVFTVVVAINLVSDCLGFLSSSLRLPVIRERVARDDRQQVLGLNQSIASLLQPVGQSIGVSCSQRRMITRWLL